MRRYKVVIDSDALLDIQAASDWYNEQSPGLGARFQKQVKLQIKSLKSNPNNYSVRYRDVRCMIIKAFPFLVHFVIDETSFRVEVFAVIHTGRNPMIWEQKVKP